MINLTEMQTLKSSEDSYAELDWYAGFTRENDPDLVYEIYHNGGGVYALINLNDIVLMKSADPAAIWVDVKGGTFRTDMALFDFLDTVMSISISGR